MRHQDIPPRLNVVTDAVIGAAVEVHRTLGPGWLERAYEEALFHELTLRGRTVERQAEVRPQYKGVSLPTQRLDLLVEHEVVVEIKAVHAVADVHVAQLVSYLRAGRYPVGLLINFDVGVLRDGVHRRINPEALPVTSAPHSVSPRSDSLNVAATQGESARC